MGKSWGDGSLNSPSSSKLPAPVPSPYNTSQSQAKKKPNNKIASESFYILKSWLFFPIERKTETRQGDWLQGKGATAVPVHVPPQVPHGACPHMGLFQTPLALPAEVFLRLQHQDVVQCIIFLSDCICNSRGGIQQ